jgi:hypothetical protein
VYWNVSHRDKSYKTSIKVFAEERGVGVLAAAGIDSATSGKGEVIESFSLPPFSFRTTSER